MGIYIGYVEQRKVGKKPEMSPAVFYDYTPIGEIRNGQIHNLSKREQEDLLPASENHNLNFFMIGKRIRKKCGLHSGIIYLLFLRLQRMI